MNDINSSSMMPGATALTRIPSGPSSSPAVLAREGRCPLGDAVGPQVAVGEAAGSRGHEHDGPRTALGLHGPGAVLHADHRAHQVQVDGGAHGIDIGVGHRADVGGAAGTGEEPVDAPGRLGRGGHGGRQLVLDGDVGHHVAGGGTPGGRCGDPPDGIGQLLLGAPADGDVHAVGILGENKNIFLPFKLPCDNSHPFKALTI